MTTQTVDPFAHPDRLLRTLDRWVAALRRWGRDPLRDQLAADDHRTYLCVWRELDHEVWLVRWPPRSAARTHDHGGAVGAVTMLEGNLVERWRTRDHAARWRTSTWTPGAMRTFSASHIHRVSNQSTEVAYSLHAYAPRLEHVTFFCDAAPGRPVTVRAEDASAWA